MISHNLIQEKAHAKGKKTINVIGKMPITLMEILPCLRFQIHLLLKLVFYPTIQELLPHFLHFLQTRKHFFLFYSLLDTLVSLIP